MTPLAKPIHRLTRHQYAVNSRQPKEIIVSLMPGDLLGFREKGTRTTYTLPISHAFRSAIQAKVNS